MKLLNKIEKVITNNLKLKKTPKKYMPFFLNVVFRKRVLFWTWISALPTVGLIALIFEIFHLGDLPSVFGIIFVGSVGIVTFWSESINCPKCGKWFFCKWYFRNNLSMNCMNCGMGPRINDWSYYQKAIKTALKGWAIFLAVCCIYIWFFQKK